jgi:hypothetical protein
MANNITLGDNNPLDYNLKPIKVGGKTSPIEMSTSYPDDTNNAKVKVVGDLEVTGSILKQPTLHILNGGTYNTGTSKFYLPLVGYNLEQTLTAGRNEFITMVAPYDGVLKKVVLRSEAACLTTLVGFHKSSEGTEVPNGTASEEREIEMAVDDTAYSFNFSTYNSFVEGDILAISVTPEAAVYDLVWTAVFEYKGV